MQKIVGNLLSAAVNLKEDVWPHWRE